MWSQKSPALSQKSPTFSQKSPAFSQKWQNRALIYEEEVHLVQHKALWQLKLDVLCRALLIEYRALLQLKTDANISVHAATLPRDLTQALGLPKVTNTGLLCRALLIEYRALLQHKTDANTCLLASTFPRNLTHSIWLPKVANTGHSYAGLFELSIGLFGNTKQTQTHICLHHRFQEISRTQFGYQRFQI